MIRKFEKEKKKHRLYGHSYQPFKNLEQLLRERGKYPKTKKKR